MINFIKRREPRYKGLNKLNNSIIEKIFKQLQQLTYNNLPPNMTRTIENFALKNPYTRIVKKPGIPSFHILNKNGKNLGKYKLANTANVLRQGRKGIIISKKQIIPNVLNLYRSTNNNRQNNPMYTHDFNESHVPKYHKWWNIQTKFKTTNFKPVKIHWAAAGTNQIVNKYTAKELEPYSYSLNNGKTWISFKNKKNNINFLINSK